MPRRRRQDIVESLSGIIAIIAMILTFIVLLTLLVIAERLVLG